MYLSKRKVILVISISILVFFFTYTDINSQDIKITDGDTIKVNGEKIRFSGIDTPELKQTCIKNDVKILCGLNAKKILVDKSICRQKFGTITTWQWPHGHDQNYGHGHGHGTGHDHGPRPWPSHKGSRQ